MTKLKLYKQGLTYCLICCLVFQAMQPLAIAVPFSNNTSLTFDIPQCGDITPAELRVELKQNIENCLNNGEKLDFTNIVEQQWKVLAIDSRIADAVDKAIEAKRKDASLIKRFKSSWSPDTAKELVTSVIDMAFEDSELKSSFEQLSAYISSSLSSKIELFSAKSSDYALSCLQQFVGTQYSKPFVDILKEKIESSSDVSEILKDEDFSIETRQFLEGHKITFEGATIIIAAQITKRIANGIARRILAQVGERMLARLGSLTLPLIGEIIGGGLIIYDLAKSFEGSFPVIKQELNSEETEKFIKAEIAKSVNEEIRNSIPEISTEISNELYSVWLDFRRDYEETVELVNEVPEFKDIFERYTKGNTVKVERISLLVARAKNTLSNNQLIQSFKDGSFERVLDLPEYSDVVLREKSIYDLIAWSNLAGRNLKHVVDFEIYKHISPGDLDRPTLLELLSIRDQETIQKLSLLKVDSIKILLRIAKKSLIGIAEELSPSELQNLSKYLQELDQQKINQLISSLLDTPSMMDNPKEMAHIVQSNDIDAAIKFWKNKKGLASFLCGVWKLFELKISPRLFIDKFNVLGLVGVLLGVILTLLFPLAIGLRWFSSLLPSRKLSETSARNMELKYDEVSISEASLSDGVDDKSSEDESEEQQNE